MPGDTPVNVRPYQFHGVDINSKEPEAIGDCPFCHRAGKFGVLTETGQFRCVHCEEHGNIYTFLSRLYDESLANTTDDDFDLLGEQRGLTSEGLRAFGLARSIITGEWLAPTHKRGKEAGKHTLTNLFRIVETPYGDTVKLKPMSTPGCKLHPFGTKLLLDHTNPQKIRVMEGLWDGIAMYEDLVSYRPGKAGLIKTADKANSLHSTIGVLAVPGAGNFNPEWFDYVEGKPIEVCFDNDHPRKYPRDHERAGQLMLVKGKHLRPGWDGMNRIVEIAGIARKRPKSVAILNWAGYSDDTVAVHATPGHHPHIQDSFDYRDLRQTVGSDKALLTVAELMMVQKIAAPAGKKSSTAAPLVEPIERESFEDLCADFSACLHFTSYLRDSLAVMLAIVVSTDLSGDVDHIWLRVIGPPGSGKSTLAEAVSAAREYVAPKSTLTGFHSGFVDYDKVTGERVEDASLLHELNGKTVIMKDADTLVNSPSRDRILSELRDLYDGASRSHYRNKVKSDFENIKLTFILCGTDALRLLNKTFLGERFLDVEILSNEDTAPFLQRASASAYTSLTRSFLSPKEDTPPTNTGNPSVDDDAPPPTKMMLKQVTYGFIKHLKETMASRQPPTMSPEVLSALESLAKYVSLLRARKPDVMELNYRPRAELATRLTNQFVKLGFSLALVLGRDSVDEEVIRIVRKVVRDTALGFQQELVTVLAPDKMGVRTMAMELNIPETNIRRLLFEMMEFGIVRRYEAPNNSGSRGRNLHLWELSPMMKELFFTVYPKEQTSAKDSGERLPSEGESPRSQKQGRGKVQGNRKPARPAASHSSKSKGNRSVVKAGRK